MIELADGSQLRIRRRHLHVSGARVTAAALVTYGTVVLAAPQVLPTFMASGGMAATAGAVPMNMQNMPMPGSTAEPAK